MRVLIKGLGKYVNFPDWMTQEQIKTAVMGALGYNVASSDEAEASFIGQAAKTFSREALDLAKKMKGEGATRDEIWKATGEQYGKPTFLDVDGHWKQEISDEGFSMNPEVPRVSEFGFKTSKGDVFNHPELRGAHPELLDNMTVSFEPKLEHGGEYSSIAASKILDMPQEHFIRIKDPAKAINSADKIAQWERKLAEWTDPSYPEKFAKDYGLSVDEAKVEIAEDVAWITEQLERVKAMPPGKVEFYRDTPSTAVHELQHGVQNIEGFARGGAPSQFANKVDKLGTTEEFDDFLWLVDKAGGDVSDFHPSMFENTDPNTLIEDYMWSVPRDNREVPKELWPELSDMFPGLEGDFSYVEWSALIEEQANAARKSTDNFVSLTPEQQYKRLAGEAEARNVQTRLNMPMDERIAKPPWLTLDVPENELIVQGAKGTAALGALLAAGNASADTLLKGDPLTQYQPPQSKAIPIEDGWRGNVHDAGMWLQQNLPTPIGGTWFENLGDWMADLAEGQEKSVWDNYWDSFWATLDVLP